jgi:hypothetical protein
MMRQPSVVPLLLALSGLSSACATTIDGTRADGGPVADAGPRPSVDATPTGDAPAMVPDAPAVVPDAPAMVPDAAVGRCRWRAGEAVVLPDLASPARFGSLLDVRPAEGGAWVLTYDAAGGDRPADVTLERLDATGHRRVDGVVRFPAGNSPVTGSLLVDEPLGRRAVLDLTRDPAGLTCGLTMLDARGNPSARRAIEFPMADFSPSSCRDLLANGAGFTIVAEQPRWLRGPLLVQLDAAGRALEQDFPALFDTVRDDQIARFAMADHSFVVASTSTPPSSGAPPSGTPLRVRHYDAQGLPLGEMHTVFERHDLIRGFTVIAAGDGLLLLWVSTPPTLPPTYRLTALSLDADGRPRGEPRRVALPGFSPYYFGGLAAALAGGDVLTLGYVGSAVGRPVVVPLAPDGSLRGDVVSIPPAPAGTYVGVPRLVATPSGALVVYTTLDPSRSPNSLVAVPLTCER